MLTTTSRRLVAVGILASLPLLGACERFSDASTEAPQTTSIGAQVMVGAVRADSLLVVADAKGATGVLSGALINTSSEPIDVLVSSQEAPTPVAIPVPASSLVRLGTEDGTSPGVAGTKGVTIPNVAAGPGSYVTVMLATAAGGQVPVQVPVISARGQYSTITPAPAPVTNETPQG